MINMLLLMLCLLVLVTSIISAMWLLEETKEQVANGITSVRSMTKLIGILCGLALTGYLTVYMSGLLTYATAR